jgi:hypothetical protein
MTVVANSGESSYRSFEGPTGDRRRVDGEAGWRGGGGAASATGGC